VHGQIYETNRLVYREVVMKPAVLIVIGVGGRGQAIARRLGSDKTVLLADYNDETLQAAAAALSGDGYQMRTHSVDVSCRIRQRARPRSGCARQCHPGRAHRRSVSVAGLHRRDSGRRPSRRRPGARRIRNGDRTGRSGRGHREHGRHMFPPLTAEQEQALAVTPAQDLVQLPFINPPEVTEPGHA
jgi:ribosomal protein S13